ncbi:MAG TPA: class I tRNA ligase family protein, partial [Pirellulales bacterium]
MPTELPKTYDPKEAQAKWLAFWERRGYFHSEPDPKRKPFTIVIPPPNVTGALHMGHALNNTLQDVLIRWRRMQGYNALWMPGTDHAGIATQSVVERLIFAQEKQTRHDLGREKLVERIWQWKDKYEARILGQLREIGASCDWQRTRFTLDEQCAKAVRETFFRMFRDGYIYRGKRLVNWDTQLQTSVADDETYTEDTKGGFWTFKYPVIATPATDVAGSPAPVIAFSTTRPETMLGDTALCVHPSDERYKHLIGKKALQPLTGREIPIIADGILADPTLGTGCVKVTPAHDANDYACYQRHPEIGIINILNPDGTINAEGGKFAGLDRYKARDAVVKAMEELGFFEGKEDRVIPLKYSDRSKSPIEPYLSDQWFVKMDRLGQAAMDAVKDGRVKFFPERYAKTYLDWLG